MPLFLQLTVGIVSLHSASMALIKVPAMLDVARPRVIDTREVFSARKKHGDQRLRVCRVKLVRA